MKTRKMKTVEVEEPKPKKRKKPIMQVTSEKVGAPIEESFLDDEGRADFIEMTSRQKDDRRTKGIKAALAKRAELLASGVVMKKKNPRERHLANPGSFKLAIAAKCFDCVGQDCDPGFHNRIRECPVTSCSLYNFRPWK